MSSRRHVVILLACCDLLMPGSPVLAAPAEPALGRLFLTPEWRETLERQRQINIQQTRTLGGDSLRLDGVVVRSSGKSTVWLNNQSQTESTRDTGVTAAASRRQPGRATISSGAEPPVDLKVGVTVNQATREKSGGLAGGEIRIHPPRQE